MAFSYRTRRTFRGLATALLCLLLAAVLIWMIWIVWLDRFVVYSRDGAKFQFDSQQILTGQPAIPPEETVPVNIIYGDVSQNTQVSAELAQFNGYYIDAEALLAGVDAVRAQVEALPQGSTVMLDVKGVQGYFYYSSTVGPQSGSMDLAAVDALIEYLAASTHYTIARLPAFQDYYYGLNYTSNGLFRPDGYALWNDYGSGQLTYWLDPTKDGTINYVTQAINELKRLGFNEVVLADFCFPDTEDLQFSGNREKAIAEAADTLAAVCSSDTFCLSFANTDPGFQLPQGERCRLYLVNVAASEAKTWADAMGMEDPEIRIVFVTELGDTRYNDYSVLRPIASARFEAE